MSEMEHQQAVKMHAAERYLLEELSPQECADFEEHYFVCLECASEVRSAFKFADNAKAVLAQDPIPFAVRAPKPSARVRSFWAWLSPSFAVPAMAVLLLGVTLYQSLLVIPSLEHRLDTATSPRAIPSIAAKPAVRGDETAVVLSAEDPFLQVFLDINLAIPVSSYLCEVHDESGALKFAVIAPAGSPGSSINLLLPAAGLQPGRYTVTVMPNGAVSKSGTTDNYSFVVKRK
jgi:hypothetical protein